MITEWRWSYGDFCNLADAYVAILEASARLLKADSGDSAPLYVGGLITQLLQTMPERMGQVLPQ
eukprot:scaffold422274_cov12-Prasinocladus_malaysianus.AAC.1